MKTLVRHDVIVAVCVVAASVCDTRVLAQERPFTIPPQFTAATSFVRILEQSGLRVQRLEDGDQRRLFPDLTTSVFIETDRGDVKIAVFGSHAAIDRVSIRYSRDPRRGIHVYALDGISPKVSLKLESGTPLYFTLHDNWLIETRDGSMDSLVKKALQQIKTEVTDTVSRSPR